MPEAQSSNTSKRYLTAKIFDRGMAQRSQLKFGNPFHLIPLHLARVIALYLDTYRIEKIQKLVDLVGAIPTCFLSIYLVFPLNARDRRYIREMLDDVTNAALTFDVKILSLQGRLDADLVKMLLQSARVEALTLEDVFINFKENVEVLKGFADSRNTAHFVHFSVGLKGGEDARRAVVEGEQRVADFVSTDSQLVSFAYGVDVLGSDPRTVYKPGFVHALKLSESLRYLTLDFAYLDAQDAVVLCEALNSRSPIEYLRIGGNQIGDEGVISVAECLKTNTSLRYLLLVKVGVTSKGAVAIAEALCGNATLELLHMETALLGPSAGEAFASMLKVNSSL